MATKSEYPRVVRTFTEHGASMQEIEDILRVGPKGAPGSQEIPFRYTEPIDSANLLRYLQGAAAAKAEEALKTAYARHHYGVDLNGRQKARPVGEGKPVYEITGKGGKKIDLRTIPTASLIPVINAEAAKLALFGRDLAGAFLHTRNHLLESKRAIEKDGKLVAGPNAAQAFQG